MKKRVLSTILALTLMLGLCLSFAPMSQAAQAPRLNISKLNLTKGTTFTIRAYNLGEGETATFKSSNTDYMTVKSVASNKKSAVVYGKAVGSAKLTVKIKKNGEVTKTLTCKIKVTPVPVSIKFTDSKITLTEGQQAYLEAIIKPGTATETPVFESSDEDVISVNVRGLVTAVSSGKATVTATLLSTGKTAKCTITVKEDPDED